MAVPAGLDANVTFKYTAEKTPARNYTAAKITVKGLKGGHSGIQIGCQRANANKVLFRFLNAASASCDVAAARWTAAACVTPSPARPRLW